MLCVAVRCSVLQCVTVRYTVVRCGAVCAVELLRSTAHVGVL